MKHRRKKDEQEVTEAEENIKAGRDYTLEDVEKELGLTPVQRLKGAAWDWPSPN
ncbi:MAG: hypothetical protein ACM3TR_07805 [Caulobacteraceae bacterium]